MQNPVTLPPLVITPDDPRPEILNSINFPQTNELQGPLRDHRIGSIAIEARQKLLRVYDAKLARLSDFIGNALQETSLPTTGSALQISLGQRAAIDRLTGEAQSALANATGIVNAYFTFDPLLASDKQLAADIARRSRRGLTQAGLKAFIDALSAALEARELSQTLTILQHTAESTAATIAKLQAQEAERLAAEAEVVRRATTYSASAGAVAAAPLIVTAAGVIVSALPEFSLKVALAAAIRTLAGVASGLVVGTFAALYPSRLGNGELPPRYALQMPLTGLDPQLGAALTNAGTPASHAQLPYRIGSRVNAAGASELFVAKADGEAVSTQVRVITASFDTQRNVYNATTTDVPPRTLTWTPITQPGDSSTTLPVEEVAPAVYEGATLAPVEVRLDSYPEVEDASWDDYVIVFPADSGLPPLYVMFRDRREEPGTMTGFGQPDATIWLADANQGLGVAIPPRIADKLRGRSFSSWRRAREALWIAVSEDPILMSQFSRSNQTLLRDGYAPNAIPSEHSGANRVFEIHHVIPLKDGGAVYDIDNLRITTPKNHAHIHKNMDINK